MIAYSIQAPSLVLWIANMTRIAPPFAAQTSIGGTLFFTGLTESSRKVLQGLAWTPEPRSELRDSWNVKSTRYSPDPALQRVGSRFAVIRVL
jgi:hypothetical protein